MSIDTTNNPRVPLTFVLTKHEFHTLGDVLDEIARLDAEPNAAHGARGVFDYKQMIGEAALAIREAMRLKA